jgi:uncharacterized protein
MKRYVTRLIPASPQALTRNRLLSRFEPWLSHPKLWRMRRRTVAAGAAIGVFFAFVIPVGQIPLAALVAMVMRANIPTACLATFINTPLTFGPVYYAAYVVGGLLLGVRPEAVDEFTRSLAEDVSWLLRFVHLLQDLGPALAVGTILFAVVGALIAYASVAMGWRLSVVARWRRRKADRA